MPKPLDSKKIQRDTLLLKKQLDALSQDFADKLMKHDISPREMESVIDAHVNAIIPQVALYVRKILRRHDVQPNILMPTDDKKSQDIG